MFDGMGGASDGQVAAFLSANVIRQEIITNKDIVTKNKKGH